MRADGLATAIKGALADAGCEMHDMDYRITDLSGEQYYFKEAALALSRTLRQTQGRVRHLASGRMHWRIRGRGGHSGTLLSRILPATRLIPQAGISSHIWPTTAGSALQQC